MTLATHAVVGASIASLVPAHPVLGFALGFSSHFLLDAIPHWDYPLASGKNGGTDPMNDDMVLSKKFLADLLNISLDALLGILLVLVLFSYTGRDLLYTSLAAALGAMFPDALQFVYWKWRHEPLASLQRFHVWISAKKKLNDQPFLGITLQILVMLVSVLLFKFIL